VDQFRDRSILPFSPDAIFSIAIRNGDQFVQLAKTSGAWVVESPQPVAAYQPAVDQLLHAFAGSPIMEFTGTTLPAETQSAGRTNAISFRALNSLGNSELFTLQLVGRSGEDRILCSVDGATGRIMIPGMLARFFSGSALRFRDPLVFQIDPNDIQRITQQLADRSITLVNRDGLFHAEAPGLVPDTDALARIIGACTRLNANQLIADDARDVTLFGFEPGCRQLIFGMASEGINRVLLIGRTASDGHVYAMRQGHDLVFTLAPDLVDLLMTPVAHSVTVSPVMPSSKEL